MLLIIRAIVGKTAPDYHTVSMKRFFRYTDVFTVPVKHILPSVLTNGRTNYAPLVAALILLFLGLGLSEFLETIAAGFHG